MLYLVATPIGNLEDITFRAVRILQECDLILCEDTRTSTHLLNHYDIQTKRESFHKYSEKKNEEKILSFLEEGKNIALISDAGTPLISDPGHFLLQACQKRSLKYTLIPGASSVIDSLVLSGFTTSPFQFLGFLPKKKEEKKQQLLKAFFYPGTTLFFESPHRLVATLEAIASIDPEKMICIARELTKTYEQILVKPAAILLDEAKNSPFKGEICLLIEGGALPEDLSPLECIALLKQYFALSSKEAIHWAAKICQKNKKEVYALFAKFQKGSSL